MLLVLLAQVGTGLVSDDEIASSGPLVRFVSGHITSLATSYHKNVGKFIVIGLVVLHLAAIAFYRWARKERLVRAMVVGDKSMAQPAPVARDTAGTRLLALGLVLACALFVRWLVSLGDVPGF
jgi:cytochrome b